MINVINIVEGALLTIFIGGVFFVIGYLEGLKDGHLMNLDKETE